MNHEFSAQWLAKLRPVVPVVAPSQPSEKAGWRTLARQLQLARNPLQRKALNTRIANDISRLAAHLQAQIVGLYAPIGGEADTRELANLLIVAGIRLAYPRVRTDNSAMDFVLADGPSALVARPRSRLMEPIGPAIEPQALDILVVPALAIGSDLKRLGRGGGFYDRYMPQLNAGAVTIGIVPSSCLLQWGPVEKHDMALTAVCCENGFFGKD